MAEKEIILNGIPSGDHECWCLLVDKETLKRVEGHEPDEDFDVGPFAPEGSPYRYKVYPCSLLAGGYLNKSLTTIYVKSTAPEMIEPSEKSPNG